MKITSAGAAKLIRKLTDEINALKAREEKCESFVAATSENVEDARPEYDYAAVRAQIAEKEAKVRAIKHALNLFNATTFVPGFDMTVDSLLVYIPQLTARKQTLTRLAERLPKEREDNFSNSGLVEYRYANYDVKAAQADLEKAADELSRAQTALDVVNNTETLEIAL